MENQVARMQRTKFACPHDIKTTGNAGDLIPIYVKEILPGDIINMDVKSLIKMTTPNFQTMDTLYADIAFYFTPNRLLWEHWKNFQGERNVGPHETQPEYTIPQVTAPSGGWGENTIADYMGIPTKVAGLQVNALPARAYCLIWNEWYRDQNRQDFTDFVNNDTNITGSNGNNYVTDPIKYGKPLKVAKLHDYFTSTLLQPQAGEPVTLNLGNTAPLINSGEYEAIRLYTKNGGDPTYYRDIGIGPNGEVYGQTSNPNGNANEQIYMAAKQADLSEATAITVAQLRQAFALQKILENNARSGTRYVEILKNRWDVTPSDATLQRPEYLGGVRIPININMVVQTSSTNEESPLGQISGFANASDQSHMFNKAFEEHGFLMGLIYIRHQRTYQQGLHRMWSRKNTEDYYMPELANLGEQAVLNKEIYAQGNDEDDEVFGYQEYGAEYKYENNQVTGQFRSNATNSFDNWHYADDYSTKPVNGEDWIVENTANVDRTLTMMSTSGINQFYFDIYFDETAVRSMPLHSIPGLLDHH